MDILSNLFNSKFNLDPRITTNLFITLLILLVLWLIRRGILQVVFRRTEDIKTRYSWRKVSGYVLFFLWVILLAPLWIDNSAGLTTYLGLVSAGVAISLRDPLTNLAGWAFILWRHPFRIGDRIQIGEHAGDVIDVRIFQFSLMEIRNWVEADQSTGRIIHIPNAEVFSSPLANYSHGFNYIWNEIPILITFESDWEKAKGILIEIAERHNVKPEQLSDQNNVVDEEYLIFYKHLTSTVYTSVSESGVKLTVRYLCDPRQRRSSIQTIWEDVLKAFSEHPDISLAYPTYRYVGDSRFPWQNNTQ
jgi:small-conductance mechanosensitive channel